MLDELFQFEGASERRSISSSTGTFEAGAPHHEVRPLYEPACEPVPDLGL
ncbi:hypothetical protein [Streptomyces sp. SYSU K217416]